MSQFITITVFDASLVTGIGGKSQKPYYALSGRGVELTEAQERFGGMLFFSRGPSGYSLQEQLKSNPFPQGSDVEVKLHLSEDLEFAVVGLKVVRPGQGVSAVRQMQKKSEVAPAPAAGAQAPSEVRVR